MPIQPIEVKDSGEKRTPTLRKWLTLNKAPDPRRRFDVRLVFVSSEYKSITLLTEAFKVTVYEQSPLYGAIIPFIEAVSEEECGAGITISDPKLATWILVPVEKEIYSWERTEFGYAAKHTGKTRSPKNSGPKN